MIKNEEQLKHRSVPVVTINKLMFVPFLCDKSQVRLAVAKEDGSDAIAFVWFEGAKPHVITCEKRMSDGSNRLLYYDQLAEDECPNNPQVLLKYLTRVATLVYFDKPWEQMLDTLIGYGFDRLNCTHREIELDKSLRGISECPELASMIKKYPLVT